MSWTPYTEKEVVRRCFSLSNQIKKNWYGHKEREELTWTLSVHYQDALFATPENPVEVKVGKATLQLFPSNKDARKIRVQVKRR